MWCSSGMPHRSGAAGFPAQEIDIAHQNAIPVAGSANDATNAGGVVGAATFRVLVQLHTAFKTFRPQRDTFAGGAVTAVPQVRFIGAQHLHVMPALHQAPGEVRHASSIATEFLRWIQIRHSNSCIKSVVDP